MKRSHIVLLITVASVGLLLALLSVIAGRSDPTLAAPRLDYALRDPLRDAHLPSYQAINCTLSTTTTDVLEEANTPNDDSAHAAALSDYNDLALAPGDKGATVPPDEDWFRLDNAKAGSTYEVEAVPDKTNNYNLGIIVYDANLTPIVTDADPADNHYAQVSLEADSAGPYYFKVYQLTTACSGETYYLDVSVTTPPDAWDEYEPNDSFSEVYDVPIATAITLEQINFYPYSGRAGPDEDWFAFYVKAGLWYEATTSNLVGVDTYMEIRDQNNNVIKSSDNEGGGFASQATWQASYDGDYYIRITNRGSSSESQYTYNLTIEQLSHSHPHPQPYLHPPTWRYLHPRRGSVRA